VVSAHQRTRTLAGPLKWRKFAPIDVICQEEWSRKQCVLGGYCFVPQVLAGSVPTLLHRILSLAIGAGVGLDVASRA